MSKGEKPDRVCIRDFAAFLNAIGRPVDGVDSWPEDQAQGEIDAIIGHYAIQHTSVDALPRGREADDRFKKVIGDLEQDSTGKLGFPLLITWDWDRQSRRASRGRRHGQRACAACITHDAAQASPVAATRSPASPASRFSFDVTEGRADSASTACGLPGTTPATRR